MCDGVRQLAPWVMLVEVVIVIIPPHTISVNYLFIWKRHVYCYKITSLPEEGICVVVVLQRWLASQQTKNHTRQDTQGSDYSYDLFPKVTSWENEHVVQCFEKTNALWEITMQREIVGPVIKRIGKRPTFSKVNNAELWTYFSGWKCFNLCFCSSSSIPFSFCY